MLIAAVVGALLLFKWSTTTARAAHNMKERGRVSQSISSKFLLLFGDLDEVEEVVVLEPEFRHVWPEAHRFGLPETLEDIGEKYIYMKKQIADMRNC